MVNRFRELGAKEGPGNGRCPGGKKAGLHSKEGRASLRDMKPNEKGSPAKAEAEKKESKKKGRVAGGLLNLGSTGETSAVFLEFLKKTQGKTQGKRHNSPIRQMKKKLDIEKPCKHGSMKESPSGVARGSRGGGTRLRGADRGVLGEGKREKGRTRTLNGGGNPGRDKNGGPIIRGGGRTPIKNCPSMGKKKKWSR